MVYGGQDVIEISHNSFETIRIERQEYHAHDLIDMRVSVDARTRGRVKRTWKTISFRPDILPEVICALQDMLASSGNAQAPMDRISLSANAELLFYRLVQRYSHRTGSIHISQIDLARLCGLSTTNGGIRGVIARLRELQDAGLIEYKPKRGHAGSSRLRLLFETWRANKGHLSKCSRTMTQPPVNSQTARRRR